MSEHWTERLSEYLDGELSAQEEAALERHVETCSECAGALRDLREVVARASALEDRPPAKDLWTGIAARIGVGGDVAGDVVPLRPRLIARRFSFSLPQLIAAGIVLVLLSAGTVWRLRSGASPNAPILATDTAGAPGSGDAVPVLAAPWAPRYNAAVADLERVLAERRDQLDPKTVRVLEENLRIIDRAIERSRQALAADPTNPYLNEHLAETMRSKIELLRRATTIATAAT